MTHDMWYVTRDMWHVTRGWRWTFSQNVKFLAHKVLVWRYFEDTGTKGWSIYLISEKGFYRTGPATSGLVINRSNFEEVGNGGEGGVAKAQCRTFYRVPLCYGMTSEKKITIHPTTMVICNTHGTHPGIKNEDCWPQLWADGRWTLRPSSRVSAEPTGSLIVFCSPWFSCSYSCSCSFMFDQSLRIPDMIDWI